MDTVKIPVTHDEIYFLHQLVGQECHWPPMAYPPELRARELALLHMGASDRDGVGGAAFRLKLKVLHRLERTQYQGEMFLECSGGELWMLEWIFSTLDLRAAKLRTGEPNSVVPLADKIEDALVMYHADDLPSEMLIGLGVNEPEAEMTEARKMMLNQFDNMIERMNKVEEEK